MSSIESKAISKALSTITKITGSKFVEDKGLRDPINKAIYTSLKAGSTLILTSGRVFNKKSGSGDPSRPQKAPKDYFDLTPDEDQQMLLDALNDFSESVIKKAAEASDTKSTPDESVLKRATEFDLSIINIPEEFEGAATDRNCVTNALVTEALSKGDMGTAIAILAPNAVAIALSEWGSNSQQQTYLPEFTGGNTPQCAFVVQEPFPFFDPFALKTTATKEADGYVLNGIKSMVPVGDKCELFLVAATVEDKPAIFIVESKAAGLKVVADPSMGIRAAGLSRLILENVKVDSSALLGEDSIEQASNDYTEAIRLSRIAWASLAVGTGQAVLDYVVPYINERVAFGEPVSYRQSVAFMAANIAIELEGMRLVTWKAAALAEQGKDFAREAALAKKIASDKGMQIGLDGVQLLGGHGFVKDHPVERFYRNLRSIAVGEGIVLV